MPRPRLGERIRTQRAAILDDWAAAVRALPTTIAAPRPALADRAPPLLAWIADAADRGEPAPSRLELLDDRFELAEVVDELAELRDAIERTCCDSASDVDDVRAMHRAIDRGIACAIDRYLTSRGHPLEALDAIAAAAFECEGLDELLQRLLGVLVATMRVLDTAALWLFEPERRVDVGGRVRIDAELAREIAAAGRPCERRDAHGLRVVYGVPLVRKGHVFGVACIGSSSTAELSLQDQRLLAALVARATLAIARHVDRELAERAAATSAEAVKIREDVLAIVSHDLRNPLGTVELAASMLDGHLEGDPRGRKHVDTIRRSVDRMEHMIRDLLDTASIQAGRLALERRPEDARALLEEVVEVHAPIAAERGIRIERAGELSGVRLDCDRERLAQVFGNLVGNALKFCRRGDTLAIAAAREGARVRIVFRDTGPGIADHDLPHLFEPYYSARRHFKQGTGLGLYICKAIVEAHGGVIAVDSALGRGTTFAVTLPAA
ncbi:MAG TPA: ATP-binding protein [Kofleriaceae bacterium]|nr:ATP-binding protein [Kofleriaceae bacterium]